MVQRRHQACNNTVTQQTSEELPVAQIAFHVHVHLKWRLLFRGHSAMVGPSRSSTGMQNERERVKIVTMIGTFTPQVKVVTVKQNK